MNFDIYDNKMLINKLFFFIQKQINVFLNLLFFEKN